MKLREEDKAYWLARFIDSYGFTFKTAKEIVEQDDADYIVRLILTAYNKGKKDGQPNYNYSGGL